MSLPASEAIAAASNVYTWEPPNRVIAARYGLAAGDILRFDTNTSPAAPDVVAELLEGPWDPTLNEYPDSTYAELAEAAAAYVGAEATEILVGCGADEVLDVIAKTYLGPGAGSLVPTPTYAMYAVLASQRGARAIDVPRRGPETDYALDVAAVGGRLAEAAVAWLCVPNNPTGLADRVEDVTALLEAAAGLPNGGPIIVVDEAYHEFRPASLVPLRERYPNLVVVRTLSKAFALPGLRVGYAVAARPTIARLERYRPPGSVSTVSATVAAAMLRRPEAAAANVAALHAERERLAAGLAEVGLPARPSVTNFLLVPVGDPAEAGALEEHLLRHGIVPRTFGPRHLLRGQLRFTVRDRAQDDRLLAALAEWMKTRRTP